MPNTKYSREYLKNHFFYSKRLYLAVIIIAVALAEVGFTMTRYQAPDARLVDIQLIGGYANTLEVEEMTAALLEAGQAYELERDRAAGVDVESPEYEIPLQEVGIYNINYTGDANNEEDYYAGQKYMVMLAAQEGDIYVVSYDMMVQLVTDGGVAPLDPFIESGILSTEGVDLETVTFDEPVLYEEDEPTGNRYVYALPAAELTGLRKELGYPVADKYLVIMAYSDNQDTSAAVIRALFDLYGEEAVQE